MLETIMKDFKIASIASKAIVALSAIRNIIMVSVLAVFAFQIAKLNSEENKKSNSKWS